MGILITIGYIVACVLLFSLAIAIHEFGHFIVALKLGLRVERFSIGFGPALWKKKVGEVEYRISAIPLGGYVSIPDIDPEGTKKLEGAGKGNKKIGGESRSTADVGSGCGEKVGGESRSTADEKVQIAPWKEIAVAFAGPAMNVVLAVVLAVLLALVPSARFGQLNTEISAIIPGGPAEKAGLKVGDVILSVNGNSVRTWDQLQVEVQIAGERPAELAVSRMASVDANFCSRQEQTNSPSAGRGQKSASTDAARTVSIVVTPERDAVSGACRIGAKSTLNLSGAVPWMPARNPLKQLAWDAGSIFRVLKGLVTPKEAKATAGALGGPVMIAEGIYRSLRRSPWDGVGFLRFLNVNLAILNLLPLPVLDGGLIFFAFIALVFRRRVPEKVVTTLSMAFMYLLFGLMGILILKDSWRSWKIHTAAPCEVKVKGEGEQRKGLTSEGRDQKIASTGEATSTPLRGESAGQSKTTHGDGK